MNLNQATSINDEEVKDIMDYHKWSDEQIKIGQAISESIGAALKIIINTVPPCADRSAAIRKLRDARMDANSAITHNGKY